MAYPVLRSHSTGTVTSNATAWPVLYPDTADDGTGGIVAGDLLLCLIGADGGSRTFSAFSTGWTVLKSGLTDGSCSFNAWYKVALGTETPGAAIGTGAGSPATITCSGSEQGPWRISCYKNYFGGAPIVSTGSTGTDSGPDPDSLTLTWGSGIPTRVIAAGSSDGTVTVSTYPSGYDKNPYSDHSGGGAGAGLYQAGIDVMVSPENPGAYLLTGSDGYAVCTIGIRGVTEAYVPRHGFTHFQDPGLF